MNPNFSQEDGQIRIRPSIFTPHPAGIANVTITNIELAESTIEGWAPRLCFDLESALADERGQPRLLRSYVSTTFSPGSKLEAVVLATLGRSASDFGRQDLPCGGQTRHQGRKNSGLGNRMGTRYQPTGR